MNKQSQHPDLPAEISGSWQDAEEGLLEFGLRATPAQRIAWLEEALRLAHLCGAVRLTTAIEEKQTNS